MTLKLSTIFAAAILAAAGSANAAMDSFNDSSSGSSLALVAYDRTGVLTQQGSFMADLGYNLASFLPDSVTNYAGTKIVWNFSLNTITVTGNGSAAAQPVGTTIAYSAAFNTFKNTVQAGDLRWAVIAGTTIAGDNFDGQQYITTGNPTADAVPGTGNNNLSNSGTNSQQISATNQMANVADIYAKNNLVGTHGTADTGASFAVPADAAFFVKQGVPNQFGPNGNWGNALKWNATSANNAVSRLFFIDNQPRGGSGTAPEITTYGLGNPMAPATLLTDFSSFQFDVAANTLTWNGAAALPVPEASTWAMLLAGLGCVGFAARRRRAA